MTQEFSLADFEPLASQALVHTINISETDSDLLVLLPDLNQIHTQLSTLITKAENPNSLLRRRCGDRRGDWLQIQFDLQDTLCQIQDISDCLVALDGTGTLEILQEANFTKVGEDLNAHVYLINEFIESLGLSKLARKDPALSEIERILVDAARAEREQNPAVIEQYVENRLGGRYQIYSLLAKNGVDKEEIERLDTRIKEVTGWVFMNEPELTMLREVESLGEEKGEERIRSREEISLVKAEMHRNVVSNKHECREKKEVHNDSLLMVKQGSKMEEPEDRPLQRIVKKGDKTSEGDYEAVEVYHETEQDAEGDDDYVLV